MFLWIESTKHSLCLVKWIHGNLKCIDFLFVTAPNRFLSLSYIHTIDLRRPQSEFVLDSWFESYPFWIWIPTESIFRLPPMLWLLCFMTKVARIACKAEINLFRAICFMCKSIQEKSQSLICKFTVTLEVLHC